MASETRVRICDCEGCLCRIEDENRLERDGHTYCSLTCAEGCIGVLCFCALCTT